MSALRRRELLKWGVIIEGGLIVAAFALGAAAGFNAWAVRWTFTDLLWGVGAVLPMLVVYSASDELRQLVQRILGPAFRECRWYDLVLMAVLAGVGEELFFRGAVQPLLERIDPWVGLIAANVLFGALHALTWQYFVFAAGFGFYLSWLAGFPSERNLLAPIIAHGLYDFLAFVLIRREVGVDSNMD
jgi:membrane protease YdiL (CAAX protease family)